MRFGIAEKRNLLMVVLGLLGGQYLPIVSNIALKILEFKIANFVSMGQIAGGLAVLLIYLIKKRDI